MFLKKSFRTLKILKENPQNDKFKLTAPKHRHSVCNQMNYFKFQNKHIRSSSSSIFSTAVISGSNSAPDLSAMMLTNTTTPAGNY